MTSSHFTGGPLDGRTILGRQRPEPIANMSTPIDASGPDVMRHDYAGGQYRRVTADGEVQDAYVWEPDNERGAA